jgi:hypothetical protein
MIIVAWGAGGLLSAQTWDCGPKDNPSAVKATLANGTLRIGGKGPMGDYYPWRDRGTIASIIDLVIEEGVVSIGKNAFEDCTNLKSVTIPNSVTSIGDYAFLGCSSLTSITIPGSVKSIGDGMWAGCNGLMSINVNNDNPSYSSIDGVFFNKTQDTLIKYPPAKQSSVYTIPNSVTTIGGSAFSRSTNLTSVTIPGNVKSIGSAAFVLCHNLKSVTIQNGVKVIDKHAFRECTGLTSITIPGSVTSIGNNAFELCTGLTSVTISDGVASIGSDAFSACLSLTSVTIPRSVTTIEAAVFVSCTSLTSINVHKNNRSYVSVDGVLFNKAMDTLKRYPPNKQGTAYAIPNGVTTIETYAFEKCANLTSVTIPNSVIEIGSCAFSYCRKLTSITIPNNVTSIGDGVFVNSTRLTSVTSLNPIPPVIEDWATPFSGIPWGATLYVPAAGINAYRQAPGWKKFGSNNIRLLKE